MVIEVTFKGNRREFFEWEFPEAPAVKTPVIVEVEHGEDFGRVHSTGELALKRKAGTTHGKASRSPLRKAIRAANGDEIARAEQLRTDEQNVRVRAIEKVRTLGLDLKVSDTEWQHDKKRLTVYFTAEQRVDFRSLVRQLEGLFGTRVHMWHIGVRDEAKRVDGLGRCGRQLCSAGWLPELIPVKSSVAKDQHLSTLNPAQISGACGRLMCCLRYEHEFYVQQRKRFPKEGKIIRTSQGEEKVLSLDIFRETVTLRSVAGDTRVTPLEQLRQEMAAAAENAPGAGTATAEGGAGAPNAGGAAAAVPRDAKREERRGGRHGAGRQARSAPPPSTAGAAEPRESTIPPGPAVQGSRTAPTDPTAPTGPEEPAGATPQSGTPPAGAQSSEGRQGRRRRRGRRGGRRGHGPDGRDAQRGSGPGAPPDPPAGTSDSHPPPADPPTS